MYNKIKVILTEGRETVKKAVLAGLLIIALLMSSAGIVFAAAPADSKGPPELGQIIFIHYGRDLAPARPDKSGKPGTENPIDHYELSKLMLKNTANYYINPSGGGVTDSDAISAVITSFETWDSVTAKELFNYGGPTGASGVVFDMQNTVSWALITDSNIIAVTSLWYIPGKPPKEIVEFDVVFNTNYPWGIDPVKEDSSTIDAFDIQNIATHEAGHVVGLNDLYEDAYSVLTMYGYGSEGETIKCSLESGDILGTQKLYGP